MPKQKAPKEPRAKRVRPPAPAPVPGPAKPPGRRKRDVSDDLPLTTRAGSSLKTRRGTALVGDLD